MNQYGRDDVLRILRLPSRQLAIWQKAGLVHDTEQYSFDHLVQLRKLRDLTATRISVKNISRSVAAMKRVAGMANPLLESAAVSNGSRVTFRHSGALLDPLTRQLAFDFDLSANARAGLAIVGRNSRFHPAQLAAEVQELFLRAVKLEEMSETMPDAKLLYEQILDLQPLHAASAINLGTIHYNERNFPLAEAFYRRASEADPEYALAFFDLGNVLDELQRLPDAIAAYERALTLVPQYADAHYNLALAYERMQQPRRALRHWQQYAKLDPTGPWASHARSQARRILSADGLSIVTRHGRIMGKLATA